jgi:hypothetical protein
MTIVAKYVYEDENGVTRIETFGFESWGAAVQWAIDCNSDAGIPWFVHRIVDMYHVIGGAVVNFLPSPTN